jgi:antitoxin component YwqK of YwqJK toxin-antitoxin module
MFLDYKSDTTPINSNELEHDGEIYRLNSNNYPFTGMAEDYYLSEKNAFEIVGVKKSSKLLDGQMHGWTKSYRRDGAVCGGKLFKHGVLITEFIGEVCLFCSAKGIRYEMDIDDNGIVPQETHKVFSGISHAYDQKNRLIRSTSFINGLKNGIEKHFSRTGALKISKQYLNNNLHGHYQSFDEGQTLLHEYVFKDGFTKILDRQYEYVNEKELKQYICSIEAANYEKYILSSIEKSKERFKYRNELLALNKEYRTELKPRNNVMRDLVNWITENSITSNI